MVSGNRKKIDRARLILGEAGWGVRSEDLKLQELQSDSVAEVARHKSAQAHAILDRAVMVTDYGLEIDCLNGFPGPYTDYARRTIGCEGLIRLVDSTIKANPDLKRTCRWNMCIVYVDAQGESHTFEAPLTGTIAPKITTQTIKDNLLFAFVPDTHKRPLGEMSAEEYATYFASTPCVYHDFATWLKKQDEAETKKNAKKPAKRRRTEEASVASVAPTPKTVDLDQFERVVTELGSEDSYSDDEDSV